MVFNSPAFLFMFLPVSCLLYALIPGLRGKNALLAALSLVFYAFGGLGQVPVLLLCAVWTWGFGLLLSGSAGGKKELLEKPISRALEEIMENRRAVRTEAGERRPLPVENETGFAISVAAPVVSEGDVLGCVMFLVRPGSPEGSELEFKLAQTVAGFLGRQMES